MRFVLHKKNFPGSSWDTDVWWIRDKITDEYGKTVAYLPYDADPDELISLLNTRKGEL